MFSPAFSLFFLSSYFFQLFSAPLFSCLYNLLTVVRGCFTPIGVIHLSLLLSSLFLSFFSSVVSFYSFLFLSSLLVLFSLSPCRFSVHRPPPCRTASDGPVSGEYSSPSSHAPTTVLRCLTYELSTFHFYNIGTPIAMRLLSWET